LAGSSTAPSSSSLALALTQTLTLTLTLTLTPALTPALAEFAWLVLPAVRGQCIAVNDSMRFVIAGLGWWGRSWTDVLKIHPKAEIVATVDPSPGAREWSQEHLSVAHFSDLDSAFREIDAEAVLITTPPKLHAPVLIRAIELGKHALVEKPLATSPEDAALISNAVERADTKVMVGQGYRFMDSATILRQTLRSGKIGELRAVRILFRQYVPDLLEQEHPLYQLKHSILIDMANHHFDLIRYLTGQEFSKVTAFEYETPDSAFRYPSSALCLLTLENGVSVVWDGDWCHRQPRTSWEGEWEFIGTEARMFWRGEQDKEIRTRYNPAIFIESSGGKLEKVPFEESIWDRRLPVLDHFIESIIHGRQPEPSVRDNLKMLRGIFGCIESATVGREVFLVPAHEKSDAEDHGCDGD
jgi:predicted dehydrogenase